MLRFLMIICLPSLVLGHGDFTKECLAAHNELRKRHGAPPLEIGAEVQEYVEKQAAGLAAGDNIIVGEGKYGGNLHQTFGNKVSAKPAVDNWYKDIELYDFDKPEYSASTVHFTQIVWKSSKRLGCAYKSNTGGIVFIVAAYDPKIDKLGDFANNVGRPSNAVAIRINSHIFILSGAFSGLIIMHVCHIL